MARKTKNPWLPVYILGTVIILAIVLSGIISKPVRHGNVPLGGHCSSSNDCKEGSCYYYRGKKLCLKKCKGEKHICPLGYHCQTVEKHSRRRTRFYDICVPD